MRSRHAILLGVVLALSVRADDKPKDKTDVNLDKYNAEIAVLNVLYTLQPTPAQLKAIAKAAPKTMQKPPISKTTKVSPKLRQVMVELRDALAASDEEQVQDLFAKFDELRDAERVEFDDVEITKAAREQAPAILQLLTARQVANYVASVEDFPDPVERLVQAMDQSHKIRGKDWQTLRDDTAAQVGWLVAGLDKALEDKVRDKATALLNRTAALKDDDYTDEKRAELAKEARGIVGKVGPTDILRHFMERVLAETLSNYRLTAALEAREKKS